MIIFSFSGYPTFLMKTRQTSIDVRRHPVGYITDYLPHNWAVNSSEGIYIQLINIPEASNITLHIEFLNLTTTSQNPLFHIYSYPSGFDYHTSKSVKNLTHNLIPPAYGNVFLTYLRRDQRITGELVRIKYTGLSKICCDPFWDIHTGLCTSKWL